MLSGFAALPTGAGTPLEDAMEGSAAAAVASAPNLSKSRRVVRMRIPGGWWWPTLPVPPGRRVCRKSGALMAGAAISRQLFLDKLFYTG